MTHVLPSNASLKATKIIYTIYDTGIHQQYRSIIFIFMCILVYNYLKLRISVCSGCALHLFIRSRSAAICKLTARYNWKLQTGPLKGDIADSRSQLVTYWRLVRTSFRAEHTFHIARMQASNSTSRRDLHAVSFIQKTMVRAKLAIRDMHWLQQNKQKTTEVWLQQYTSFIFFQPD